MKAFYLPFLKIQVKGLLARAPYNRFRFRQKKWNGNIFSLEYYTQQKTVPPQGRLLQLWDSKNSKLEYQWILEDVHSPSLLLEDMKWIMDCRLYYHEDIARYLHPNTTYGIVADMPPRSKGKDYLKGVMHISGGGRALNLRRTVAGLFYVTLHTGRGTSCTYAGLIKLLMENELMDPIVGHSLLAERT